MEPTAALSEYADLFSKTSTFISIDVVNSTALKSGENEQDIIYTFLSYHKLIRELAYLYHGEIITISGDGVMCRFERPGDAATAVQAILDELPAFNKRQNRMSRPVSLRLGVNTGKVMESQSLSPGQIISHILDVAAKLQQDCAPNEARFSQETVNVLPEPRLPLVRMEWDVKLQTTAYCYRGSHHVTVVERTLPNPVRVLIMDDELSDLMKLRKILWARRHDPLSVYTAAQASVCVTSWKPHVILASTDLPWNSGWDFLRAVRSDPRASAIPIIVMSQQTTGETVERCFGSGANGFIRKPLEDQQIVKRMDVVLREFYL